MNEIKRHMEEGLFWGYIQLCELLDRGDFHLKIIEYIFTVNVSQRLLIWSKKCRAEGKKFYSVNIEYNAEWFFENAFEIKSTIIIKGERPINKAPRIIYTVPVPKGFRRKKTGGRMDIAITERRHFFPQLLEKTRKAPIKGNDMESFSHYKSECKANFLNGRGTNKMNLPLIRGRYLERSILGIEIKGINPSKSSLREDFERIAQCITHYHFISQNSIDACFILYALRLDSPRKAFSEKEIPNEVEIRDQEAQIFSSFKFYNDVIVTIDPFDIYTYPLEDFERNTPIELWDDFDPQATGSVWGIIVTIRKKIK